MKTSQITFITNSLKAREILKKAKMIPTSSKANVATWLESASDEDIDAIARKADWTEDTVAVAKKDVKTTLPPGAVKESVTITDAKGAEVAVDVVNCTLIRRSRVWNTPKDAPRYRGLVFRFRFGNTTIKTSSKLLEKAYADGEFEKGDVIPFKFDSIKLKVVPADIKNGKDAYPFWEGAILETGNDMLEDMREAVEERETDLASMSKGAQAKIEAQSDDRQVDAFFAKHGR